MKVRFEELPAKLKKVFDRSAPLSDDLIFFPAVINFVSTGFILILCAGLLAGSSSYIPLLFDEKTFTEGLRNFMIGYPLSIVLLIWRFIQYYRRFKGLKSNTWKYGLFLTREYLVCRETFKNKFLVIPKSNIVSFYYTSGRNYTKYIHVQLNSEKNRWKDPGLDVSLGLNTPTMMLLEFLLKWKDNRHVPERGKITALPFKQT